jgi:Short C-terminal domain
VIGARRVLFVTRDDDRWIVADELGKLAALRDSGALSEEEFAAMKAKLLA